MSSTSSRSNSTLVKQQKNGIPSQLLHHDKLFMNNTKNDKVVIHQQKNNNNNNKKSNKQQQQKEPKATIVKLPNVTPRKPSASAPTTPQQRRTVLPVKARRVERRKEIVSMTKEAIIKIESFESDDSSSSSSELTSSSTTTTTTTTKKKNNKHKKALSTHLVVPTAVTKKREQQQRSRRRSSSAIDVRSSIIYAGPTFNNAPAPSALPIPAFSPTLVSIDLKKEHLQRHSKDIMNILSTPPNDFDMDLSEIQRGLRSMLKI